MKHLLRELGIVAIALFALNVNAQTTPAPCDRNSQYIQDTITPGPCFDTPDCSSGLQCMYNLVIYDTFYGVTCDNQYVFYCAQPNIAKERKHAQELLARLRVRRANNRG